MAALTFNPFQSEGLDPQGKEFIQIGSALHTRPHYYPRVQQKGEAKGLQLFTLHLAKREFASLEAFESSAVVSFPLMQPSALG